jgi:hypothetical protein
LDAARQKYRTTRPTEVEESDKDKFPESDPGNQWTHNVFLATFPTKNTLYTDQTGAYPITSNRGVKYVFCAYDYDSNKIFIRGLTNRTKGYSKPIKKSTENLQKQVASPSTTN